MHAVLLKGLLVAGAVHLLRKGGLAGSKARQRDAVRGAADVVEPDRMERLHGIGVAAVLAAHAAHEVGIAR